MDPSDLAVDQGDDVRELYKLTFEMEDSRDTIVTMRSSSPITIPREGEYVVLAEGSISVTEGEALIEATAVHPEPSNQVYRVNRVGHDYELITPDEDASDAYRSGVHVHTRAWVSEDEPE